MAFSVYVFKRNLNGINLNDVLNCNLTVPRI
jgi:hypothetical protein